MATHILPQSADDELFNLMAELDEDAKKDKAQRPKIKRAALAAPAPIEVQWHPFGTKFMLHHQHCACGAEFQHVLGLYLVDITKNGAIRSVRNPSSTLPPAYAGFSPTAEEELEEIPFCPWCYAPEQPEVPAAAEPSRPLTLEDRDALKDLDEALGI